MSGGLAYGYFDAAGSEALDAVAGAYVTVSGGYLGTYNTAAAMIWSGSTLDPVYWSITGGYFTSNSFNDGSGRTISVFVPIGQVTTLSPTLTHPLSGATEYRYQLTIPRTITFDAEGGSTTSASDITGAGGRLGSLSTASKGSLTFNGWYTSPWGGTEITTDYIFNNDTTVYAQYEGGYAPNIDIQPADAAKTAGSQAELTVAASLPAGAPGGSSLYYRWQKSENGGGTWSDIAGGADASLTTDVLDSDDDGVQYRVIVGNAYDGSEVLSDVASIAIRPTAGGLTVTSTDPAGANNDGKTQVSVTETVYSGNRLVYLNIGAGSPTPPAVGEALTGYADLPEDGIVEAANGDHIAVAEVDADGKVVRYGATTAVVIPAAGGLTVTSTDPAGANNDGKTQISVAETVAEGHKLVYLNAGNSSARAPEVGEVLSGYTNLPDDALIAAANGDYIAIAEVDSAGRAVRFGQTQAVVSKEPDDDSAPAAPSSTASADTNNSSDVEVLVNGKIEYAGTATVSASNGQTVTTIDVNKEKILEKLEAEGQGATVTIPWQKASDIIVGRLTGDTVKSMEDKGATLILDTSTGAYKIPTKQIQISSLAEQFGGNVKLEDVQLQIHIAVADTETITAAKAMAARAGVTLIATPVTFTVDAEYSGKSIEITDYSEYVERTVALPEGVDPNKITTGVVLEIDGTLRHVPTKVTKENDVYYAQINSLTNSDYGVIWHPLEFADMSNHWAKAAVNDMGSRLVVNGVGDGNFNPDADITRAEFAAIMVRGLGLRLDKGTAPFTDVTAAEWYADAVSTAYRFGLIAGYEDGTFRPMEKISRQEAMTIVARAMQTTGLKEKMEGQNISEALQAFRDADSVAEWAKESVQLVVAARVVNGRTAYTLESNSFITRAEVAVIMQRLLQKSELI